MRGPRRQSEAIKGFGSRARTRPSPPPSHAVVERLRPLWEVDNARVDGSWPHPVVRRSDGVSRIESRIESCVGGMPKSRGPSAPIAIVRRSMMYSSRLYEMMKTPAMQHPTPGARSSIHGIVSSSKASPEAATPPSEKRQK